MKRISIACVALATGVAGCQTSQEPAPSPVAAKPATIPATAASMPATVPATTPAKKEPNFYEIASGDTAYVFASVTSANNHLSGTKLVNPISKPDLRKGKTVVFENVGADTDALLDVLQRRLGTFGRARTGCQCEGRDRGQQFASGEHQFSARTTIWSFSAKLCLSDFLGFTLTPYPRALSSEYFMSR